MLAIAQLPWTSRSDMPFALGRSLKRVTKVDFYLACLTQSVELATVELVEEEGCRLRTSEEE